MKKSHTHAKHVWYASLDSHTDMTSIFDEPSQNRTSVITNGVGEKAWKPESIDHHGFYNFTIDVTNFVSLKWTDYLVDYGAKKDKSYPISYPELDINTLTLPKF